MKTETENGHGLPARPCSEIFGWRLDALRARAETKMSAALKALRSERWRAHQWLIREYRRMRLMWEAEAVREHVTDDMRGQEWAESPRNYSAYIDRCRETFGLPVRHHLAPLPGADERKELLISEFDRELEDHRAKYDPFYFPNIGIGGCDITKPADRD